MSDTTYNGWANYATWRVMLEVFDGIDPAEWFDMDLEAYELGQQLKEHVECLICDYKTETSLAQDYALAFLSDVNWREIAQHLIDDYVDA